MWACVEVAERTGCVRLWLFGGGVSARCVPQPRCWRVQVLEEMARTWESEYNVTTHNRFRDYDNIDVPIMHNMYCQVWNHGGARTHTP